MRNELFGGSLGLLIAGTLCTTGVVPSASGQIAENDKNQPVHRHGLVGEVVNTPGSSGGVAGAGCEYANDDGTADNATGFVDPTLIGMSAGYVAIDGCTTLTSIQVAWGVVPDGQACTLQIYNDPNKDGDPSDITAADQLVSVEGLVANADTDVYNDYPIPDTVVAAGSMFWVVALTQNGDGDFPAQWSLGNAISPLNVLLGQITDEDEPFTSGNVTSDVGHNFMVRAVGSGTPVSCFAGDTNGTCSVDVTDLVNVITAWGGDGVGVGFNADLNNDGTVDVTDLVNGVITNWGSCTCTFRACCFQDGTCADLTPDGCFGVGGAIQAAGSTCADTECELLLGACCLAPSVCEENLPAECTAAGGTHSGAGTTCASGICDPQSNDDCAGAIALEFGVPVMGTTANATPDETAQQVECLDEFGGGTTAPGNWYKVTGNGNTLTASMCNLNEYDGRLVVFCGDCDGFFCLDANDDGCGASPNTGEVTWCSENGQEYLVFVTGFAAGVGPYELVVNSGSPCGEPTPCQDNDSVCLFATDVEIGATISGYDTCEGITSATAPDCGQGGQTAEGRWIRVIGDGSVVTVALCSAVPLDFNSRLSAYCGPCDALECVASEPTNNSGCAPFTEEVSFCSLDGFDYYILVSGSAECGEVEVSVTSSGSACTGAPCPPVGLCCVKGGTECIDAAALNTCDAAGGDFAEGLDCSTFQCFQSCDGSETLSQSVNNDPTDPDSNGTVACGVAGTCTTANGWYRVYGAADGMTVGFEVCNVQAGIGTVEAADGSLTITVRLYDTGDIADIEPSGGPINPIISRDFLVTPDMVGTLVNFDIGGVSTSGSMIVEIANLTDYCSSGEDDFRIIGNTLFGQTGVSYINSFGSCGIAGPTPMADIGFPDEAVMLNLIGSP